MDKINDINILNLKGKDLTLNSDFFPVRSLCRCKISKANIIEQKCKADCSFSRSPVAYYKEFDFEVLPVLLPVRL